MSSKVEELKAAIADESLSTEQREAASLLMAELQKQPEQTFQEMMAEFGAKVQADHAAYVADQNTHFHVCGSCYRKQAIDRERCELCDRSTWQQAHIQSSDGKRDRLIASATTYTDEELQQRIERTSMDLAYAAHCARILRLRGVERRSSFWERSGFDFYGKPAA